MNHDVVNKWVVILMALGISALFLAMIQQFLMALFLAGLFSAMARPLFLWLQPRLRGSESLASLATLLAVAVVVLIPLALLVAVVVGQALDVTQTFVPWLKERLADPDAFLEGMRRLPFYEDLLPLRSILIERAGEAATFASKFVVGGLSSLTMGTLNFFFMAFVMLYSMYFLQIDGHKLINKILYYLPLKSADEALILASIVEKETGLEADRGQVAGVFANRLRIGMPLQTDPTVIYGMGEAFDGNLRKRDLQTATPFNTYTRRGLPPTPIALPGLASLRAAVQPEPTKALYFVARGDGTSVFSNNLDDHNRAVNRYQRGR